MSVTFKLKPTAKFWDGTPVTADDVKWSSIAPSRSAAFLAYK